MYLALLLLVAGCTSGSQASASKPSSPAATQPRTVAGEPTPSASNPPQACDLPIAIRGADGNSWSGGFLSFPDGGFKPDPYAAAKPDPAEPNAWVMISSGLRGDGHALTYDRAYKRWLPVARSQVSADGRQYTYSEPDIPPNSQGPVVFGTKVHVVDVATGKDRVVLGSNYGAFTVLDFEKEGIYMSPACVEGCGADAMKLDLFNPATGSITRLNDIQGSWVVWPPSAWTTIPSHPASGQVFPFAGNADELVRVDLHGGGSSAWWTLPGASLTVIGVDYGGDPILQQSSDKGEAPVVALWLTTGFGQERRVRSFEGDASAPASFVADAVADSTGTWLPSLGGLYHISPAGDLQLVNPSQFDPAGSCS